MRVTQPLFRYYIYLKLQKKIHFFYFFTQNPGLSGQLGTISFESVLRPGYFIVNKNGNIDVDSFPNTGFDEGRSQTPTNLFFHILY